MGLARFIARELGRPSRLTGRLMNLANARINARAVELLEVSSEHRVLEIGFGGGVALGKLSGQAAFVAGIDHSEPAVRSARRRFREEIERGRMQIEHAAVEAIPFEDASFDRALGVHTIYFWPQPECGLREILRVCKDQARLLLVTDTRGAPKAIAKHGFTPYTEEEQAELLTSAGFSDVRLEREEPFVFAFAVAEETAPRRALGVA